MKIAKNLKLYAVGAVIALSTLVSVNAIQNSDTQAAGCSSNSVIKCGVWSVKEMRDKYNKDHTKGTKTIFSHMGVTSYQVNSATVKSGTVYKNGNVVVDGKTVATGAETAGRWNIKGSKKVTKNGTTFYTRPTQVSFISKSAWKTYVFFDSKGRFMGAVLLDCGNPVKATNKVVPKTPAKPAPEKPAPEKPAPEVPETPVVKVETCDTETSEIVEVEEGQENTPPYSTDLSDCEEEVVETPETPEAPVEETPVVTELPKTGLSDVASGVAGLATLTAATYYYVASRRL